MPSGMRLRTWTFVACAALALASARSVRAEDVSATAATAARKHFERARAYYGQGAYREAIAELEAAHALDPNAKDLVFNLGVVHEKLSDIDEALKWFRLYTTMDLAAPERERADAYIRRLEGAKKELEEKQAALAAQAPQQPAPAKPAPSAPEPSAPPPVTAPVVVSPSPAPPIVPPEPNPPPPAPPPPLPPAAPTSGRVDALTVGAASASVAGLVFGVVMGVMATEDSPASNSTAGPPPSNTPFEQLQRQASQAHKEAILADLGFGVALVLGVTTGYLYFGRTRTSPSPVLAPTTVSAAPIPGGGALLLKGCF